MKYRFSFLACLLVTAGATNAAEDARPIIAPAPDWVLPPVADLVTPPASEGPVQVLLSDEQVRITTDAVESYEITRVKIQNRQGLDLLGTIRFMWKPDSDVLTVHRLNVLRDGQAQDLLTGSEAFTILRREDQLEQAVLTGMLTAIVQPAGLRVGDVIEMSYTLRRRDPVVHDTPDAAYVWGSNPMNNVRLRVLWPDSLPLRWRASSHMPVVEPVKANGWNDLTYRVDKLEPLLQPTGAPARFMALRMLEVTSFRNWQALSQRLAPLYVQASKLAADSPLRAEADRIRRQHATPAARAAGALRLVQDEIRYVLLTMNDGGLNPAAADETWRRRFGDCKAKSAMLLALLRELGVEADVVAVSSSFGDGLNTRLPGVGLFDHVLVRAQVDGKIYWLDGTRTGDRALERLEPPPFRWALPLTTRGSELVAIPLEPLREPSALLSLQVDASDGVELLPAPFQAEMRTRGDSAQALKQTIENVPEASREEALRVFWRRIYPGVEIEKADVAFDDAQGTATWTASGTIAMEWDPEYSTYEPHDMSQGYRADLSRPRGTDADAPYAVSFPVYTRTIETIRLPPQRQPFTVTGTDINMTVAGGEYRRTAQVKDDVFTAERSYRSILPEFPASERAEAERALLEMSRNNLFLKQPADYLPATAELLAEAKKELDSADDYYSLGSDMLMRGMSDSALTALNKALQLDPKHTQARISRAQALTRKGDITAAVADLEAGLVAVPGDSNLRETLVNLLVRMENWPRAQAVLDEILAANPTPKLRARRAWIYHKQGQTDLALRELDAALAADPKLVEGYRAKADILRDLGRKAEIPPLVAEMYKSLGPPTATSVAIAVLTINGMDSAARIYMDEDLRKNPTAEGYLSRAYAQQEKSATLADLREALKQPDADSNTQTSAISMLFSHKWYSDAAELITAQERDKKNLSPKVLGLRGVARWKTGDQTAALADFAAARQGASSTLLNTLCWDKTTNDAALEVALQECDAALAAEPGCAACMDSRALVLLRMGRYEESIRVYDRALQMQPDLAMSLFGRGIARIRNGQREEGEKDVADARSRSMTVGLEFLMMEIVPDSPSAASGK